jgi:2',3'-cyclic-nucleotide 2'-phosphodiesterase (5'-nucleotidase family)
MHSRALRTLLLWFVVLALLAACLPAPDGLSRPPQPAVKRLTILYTNDEHGWLAAEVDKDKRTTGGAAEMLGQWQAREGVASDGPFLILSGGDMWTGPAISTWFMGDPAVEAMNRMGYRAAAIGNHEFDFGLDVLRRHARAANFPFLAANLVKKGTDEPPDFVRPYLVTEVAGIKVGLIGLATRSTPTTTNPKNVAGFEFLPYADALARYAPQVQAAGAEVIVALAHVCGAEMRALAPRAGQLGVHVLTAGHCHEQIAAEVAGLPLIGAGQYLQAYVRLPLTIDAATGRVTAGKPEVIRNTAGPGGPTDAALAGRIAAWQVETEQALGEEIGYTKSGLAHRSAALLNLVMDAWLQGYATADVAMSNLGGFRQGIPVGPITLGEIVGALPFNNQIVDVAVTGAQLKANLDCCASAVAGITYRGGKLLLADGTPVDPAATYHVLVNDFMAGGGDRYLFKTQDPNPYFTAIDWRQPVVDYLKRLGTSQQDPLDSHLDTAPRTDK